MGNPFRKTTAAVTSKGNPFRQSSAETAIKDSALSPLLEEAPFAVARPSLPTGPRAGAMLPTVTTTAPAPKEFEKRLARTIATGTKKAQPFGGEEELTDEQRMQLERARLGRQTFEDVGKAFVGQPGRSIYRAATGIATLRGDPRAEALRKKTLELEEATAPSTGIGSAARLVSEMGAFAPSGIAMGALRSGLESAAGKEFSTVGRNIENPLARALADAAFDLSIPAALAAPRAYRGIKSALGTGEMVGDAFTQGLREGAGEAAEAATPSLASFGSPTTSLVPVSRAPVAPPSGAQRIAMGPVGSTSGPFSPPMAPPAPFIPTGPSRPRRIPAHGQALPPSGLPTVATAEEIAKRTKRPSKKFVQEVEGRAKKFEDLAKGFDEERVARWLGEDVADLERPRGGEPPAGYEGIPMEAFDELTYPDKSPKLRGDEDIMALREASRGKPLKKLSDRELEIELEARKVALGETVSELGAVAESPMFIEMGPAGATRQTGENLTSAMKRKRTMAQSGRSAITGELLSTAKERRELAGGLTEEQRGVLEQYGIYDPKEYADMKKAYDANRFQAQRQERAVYNAQVELVRRHNDRVAKGIINAAPLPEPREAEFFQYAKTAEQRAATAKRRELLTQKVEKTTMPEGMQNRPGFSASPITGALGGFGAGATVGATTDEEGGMSPLQRALLYGAAGAVGGAALMRRRGAMEAVTPSIPELAPIAETINIGKRAPAPEAPALLGKMQRAYNQIVSETYVLEKAAEKFGTPEQAKVLPGIIAQQQGSRRAAEAYLEDTLTPIISGLSKPEKDNVRALLKARRELQILQQGGAAKSTTPLDVLERAVAAGNADPKVASAADQITKMHRDLLAMRYQAGLLTDEAYEAIKASDDFYTPFFREAAQDPALGGMLSQRKGGFNILGTGVKQMDRTAEALEKTADPLETIIVDAARTYRDVAKQRVSNVIFGIADNGDLPFLERIKADPMNPPKGEGIIQQMRNGKLMTYKVKDKDLYNALAGQDATTSGIAAEFAKTVARNLKAVKTAGITILPDFAAANVIRDVALSGIQRPDVKRALGEAAIGAGIGGTARVYQEGGEDPVKNFLIGAGLGAGAGLYARPFLETMAAVKSIVLPKGINIGGKQIVDPDNLFREFLADGASTEGFYVRNADDAARILKRLESEPGFSRQDIINPKNWWETLRKIGSVGEQATRVAAYRQLKEAGATGAEAALGAQDRTLRFASVGAGTKGIAAVTPFWNAKVQGWDKLARTLKDPKARMLGAGMLFAPSVSLWMINKDNPEYWDRPIYERNLFWLVPKSLIGEEGEKGFYRIPKPFEIGYMFASLPERLLDYAAQRGAIASASPAMAEPGKGLARAAQEMGTSTFEGTIPFPEIAALPTQLVMNRDFFRGRPIVNRPQLSPELQVTEETSAIARALAKAGVSPEKTDFFIRNAFGTAGGEASKMVDIAARAAGVAAPEAKPGIAGVPVLSRFGERFSTSNKGQTDPEAMARERLRELNQVETDYREYKRLAKSGSPKDQAALLDFVEKNESDLLLSDKLQPIESELEKLSRLRTDVRKDPSLSPEERRAMLEVLRERGQGLSKTLIGVRKP